MGRKKLTPIHPGEILLEEFLKPLGLSQYRIARDLSVPPRRINEIVHGKRGITADTALRLGRYFGTSARFWLNFQARDDPAATSIMYNVDMTPFPSVDVCPMVKSMEQGRRRGFRRQPRKPAT
jgi:addiction module HigA family antidote